MPADVSSLFDVRTDSIEKNLQAINEFREVEYEIHVNFLPEIVCDWVRGIDRNWKENHRELFKQLDAAVNEKLTQKLKNCFGCRTVRN